MSHAFVYIKNIKKLDKTQIFVLRIKNGKFEIKLIFLSDICYYRENGGYVSELNENIQI